MTGKSIEGSVTKVRELRLNSMDIKTEHNGPKRGNGAYWGYKWLAKKLSNKARRKISRQAAVLTDDNRLDKVKLWR